MKSLPLKLMGTECSIVLWFFVSLEMVLNGTLGCFYYCQSMKNSKPILPQKVLVYSLEDYPFKPGGIPQVWWSTIFFVCHFLFVRLTMYTHFTFTLMAHCTSGAIRGSVPCSRTL